MSRRTNVRDTSILAFFGEVKPTLSQRQEQVLAVFFENPDQKDFSNMELAGKLEWSINRVTPRTHELVKLGVLKESRKRSCKVTGRRVWAWKIA